MRRWLVATAFVGAALGAGAALAAGPWPGLAGSVQSPSGVTYSATFAGGVTTVKATKDLHTLRARRLGGTFGVPAVTTVGAPGGLSPDGKLLVLVPPPNYNGLRKQSTMLVLSTDTLATVRKIVLPGEFGYDAISPNRRFLYLLQHIETTDLTRYVVRAYDLRAGRLLPGAIVDKRNVGEQMRGMPIARTTSARGDWVYTLYAEDPETQTTFVHAQNASGRYAFCIDLPAWPAGVDLWTATLRTDGRTLYVVGKRGETIARIDTNTLKVR